MCVSPVIPKGQPLSCASRTTCRAVTTNEQSAMRSKVPLPWPEPVSPIRTIATAAVSNLSGTARSTALKRSEISFGMDSTSSISFVRGLLILCSLTARAARGFSLHLCNVLFVCLEVQENIRRNKLVTTPQAFPISPDFQATVAIPFEVEPLYFHSFFDELGRAIV